MREIRTSGFAGTHRYYRTDPVDHRQYSQKIDQGQPNASNAGKTVSTATHSDPTSARSKNAKSHQTVYRPSSTTAADQNKLTSDKRLNPAGREALFREFLDGGNDS
jgi:hypothetical protein